MEAIGLSINNWGNRYNGVPTQIIEWISGGAYKSSDGEVFSLSRSTPIPLTEEWLIKFGFKTITPHDKIYFKGDMYINPMMMKVHIRKPNAIAELLCGTTIQADTPMLDNAEQAKLHGFTLCDKCVEEEEKYTNK